MRASRLLSILLLLRSRDQIGATELARTLEVSVRTVYRDIEALSTAGIPVYATRGAQGGYRLVDGFRSSLSALTGDEAQALGLLGLPGAASDLGLGPVLTAAHLKLIDALPPATRDRARAVHERFLLDVPGWPGPGSPDSPATPVHLAALAAATWDGAGVRIRYQRTGPGRPVQRTLHPLGLVLKAGNWYLVGAPRSGGPRVYRVSRVLGMTPSDGPPLRPDGFDLAAFWKEHQADYERRLYPSSATVRFDEHAWALVFLLGGLPARAARASATAPDEHGRRTALVPIESERHALHALLQLGAGAEVLEPPSLRTAVAAEADRLRALYSERAGGSSARGTA